MSEMLEEPKAPRKKLSMKWPLRLIAIFAGALMIGFGLCAVDANYFPRQAAEEFGPNGWVGGIGAWMVVLSAIGLGVSLLVLVVRLLANALQKE